MPSTIQGPTYSLVLSPHSFFTQVEFISLIPPSPQSNDSKTNYSTTSYLELLRTITPTLVFNELCSQTRALTEPSTPQHNQNKDNLNYDLIAYVDMILGSSQSNTPNQCKVSSSRYKVISVLGHGSFGQVLKCLDMNTGLFVALKVLRNRSAYFRQGMLEIAILELLNDKFDKECIGHTLRLIDHFLFYNHICIVTEMLGINLYELMCQNGCRGFGASVARGFVKQILETLIQLHANNIIHCDLKPENVLLVDFTKQIRVIDFGSACFENSTLYTYIQSRHYRAPEVILGLPYSSAIDMWSLGCIAAEFFIGIPLFPGSSEYNQIYKIIRMIGIPPSALLEKGTKTDNFFNKLKGANGKTLYELKTKEQYERDNDIIIDNNKDYYNYTSLKDFCMRVPFRISSKDKERKDEFRSAFYDFLNNILIWEQEKRITPQQAINHPFITKAHFELGSKELKMSSDIPQSLKSVELQPKIEDVLKMLFPSEVIAKTQSQTRFNQTNYYDIYLAALEKGVVLNIQSPNPFTMDPITPSSLTTYIQKEKEDFRVLDDLRKLTKSVDNTDSIFNTKDVSLDGRNSVDLFAGQKLDLKVNQSDFDKELIVSESLSLSPCVPHMNW
ncbi:serine/threonine protein kinase ppk15, putative [Entamoeba invadens IP1]|uniref:Serine/threonine protein kinase ppk15, putative n=1 Tax=Entamoeba invadens IP1 TaxID=370355 RepID=A0A0A1TWT8_ENTIV|nr:serine/threonine protein kinase ppk15, putative [Entamoeba invadens IP1]ELP85682.1 serine/threonine protein kinase ppk15, putative [Entamoeba invadens IP1]|eukprot:XP_004185028.1 serine/threonine protein kinase ppk15, putative [Entamoeba invadens IP1]